MRDPARISDELERSARDSSTSLEQRLGDTCKWFYQNRDRIPREDLIKRIEFLEKFVEIQIEISAALVERLQMSENRQKSERLWLPSGISMSGDARRFG